MSTGRKRSRMPNVEKKALPSGAVSYRIRTRLTQADGSKRQVGPSFPTERQAIDWYVQAQADERRGIHQQAGKSYTVRQAVEDFVQAKALTVRASTARNYRLMLAHLVEHCGDAPLASLSRGDISKMMAALQREGMAPSSINQVRAVCANMLAEAQRDGLVRQNVASLTKRLKQPETERTTLTREQMRALLAEVDGHRFGHGFHLSARGLRRGEVLALRWRDIDLDAREITIRRNRTEVGPDLIEGPPKSERSRRVVPIDDALLAALKAAKRRQAVDRLRIGAAHSGGGESGYVICEVDGSPLRPSNYSRAWLKVVRDARLPRVNLHSARHSAATTLLTSGADVATVARLLGHDPVQTLLTYSHLDRTALKAAADVLGEALGG